jgi:hypothetical protein
MSLDDSEIEKITKQIGKDATKHIDDEWWESAEQCAINAAYTAYIQCLIDLGLRKEN